MRRIVLNKNIDKYKYYQVLNTIERLMKEYTRYKNAARRAKSNSTRTSYENKAKTYYENEVEPFLDSSSYRFDITSEEILNDLDKISDFC